MPNKITKEIILALGAESAGNFSVSYNKKIFHSKNFGDLLIDKNFYKFKKEVLSFLNNNNLKPTIILTDIHPLYMTTTWGKELVTEYKAKYIEVQHHIAHIFSQIKISDFKNQNHLYGIVLDGTGLGLDENIWGGEIIKVKSENRKVKYVKRIGHLENQTLIGGDLAIHEPARVLMGILEKFLDKKEVYDYIKKYYNKNKFELLWNQLQEKFNCQKTSSAGRILDATSILLGFSKNERKEKHGATYLLEKNSTKSYSNLKPVIKDNILLTTPLFKYLIKNINKDKYLSAEKAGRLAATSQFYIAEGLYKIIKKYSHSEQSKKSRDSSITPQADLGVILSGGLSNNKIILNYFESHGLIKNKKSHIARGDAGLSLGQINYYLSTYL